MEQDTLLKRKLTDLAEKAYQQNIYTYSNFLSMSELSIYHQMDSDLRFIPSSTYGGNDACERQIVQFGSADLFGYEGTYPIQLIRISPLLAKFSDTLTHRDFLGAILNLGIDRSLIGDIIIRNNCGYVFCMDHIADYILDNLTKIKHTNIKCEYCDQNLSDIKPHIEHIECIAASNRIDAVAATLTKLSRSKVIELFRTQKIFINGKVMENNSYMLKPNDILVIRGLGKFIYDGCGNETRKGRMYVQLQKYI